MTRLDTELARVLRRDACSGCGACCLLDPGLAMTLGGDGHLRPARVTPSPLDPAADRAAAAEFRTACPGATVRAAAAPGTRRHPTMGPVLEVWEAWASDDEIRHLGSSGGVLTALAAWLTESGEATQVIGAAAAPTEPRRTVTVRIQTRAEALAAAGSRYAPVANAADPKAIDGRGAVVGKPCEIVALRALATVRGDDGPLLLSFFCAGTPSQDATDSLLDLLGLPPAAPLATLRYRGHGWPGEFRARAVDGQEVSASYDDSWGHHLGPTIRWRCKICPDGVGESSDITAADLWHTDERGYPVFTDRAGISALIARTPRGLDVIRRAVAAGVIIARPIEIADLATVQPLQRNRRETLLGRLLGALAAGRGVPRFRGFGLLRLAAARPRDVLRTARGTFRRSRAARHARESGSS